MNDLDDELNEIRARRAVRAQKDERTRAARATVDPGEMPDRLHLHELSAPQLLALRYRVEDQLAAAGSVTGRQMERLRSGVAGPPPDGAMSDGLARLRVLYQDVLTVVHAAALTPEQTRVCKLRYGSVAGVLTTNRLVPPHEVKRQPWGEGASVLGTDLGEEVVGNGPDGTKHVRGSCARWPSFEEIGEQLAMTARHARALANQACAKVRGALQERAHRIGLEG